RDWSSDVCSSDLTAQRVLEHVRRSGGFVTVLPLDLLRAPGGRGLGALAGQTGVLAAATEVIEHDPRFATLFEQLLGGTAIVEDLRAATALARRFDQRPRMVTLAGDTLEASGAMSGGKRSQQGTVLGAAADLEEAEAAAEEADAAARAAAEAFAACQAEVRALIERAQELGAASAAAARELAAARERWAGHARLVADLEARREQLAGERAELERQDAPDAGRLAALGVEAAEAEAALTAAAERLEAARTAESEARLAAAAAEQARAVAEERWRTYQEARERYRTSHQRAAELRMELGALGERGEELARESTEASAARDLAAGAVPAGLEAVEAALTLAQEGLAAFPPGVEELDLSEGAARARLRDVEAELEALGPVNHRAATDLAEATERKENLEVEAVQATLAVTELEAALERI